MGIYEVEIRLGYQNALDTYVEAYEKRYKIKPISENIQADQTVIKDLIKTLGLDRTHEILRTYLKMNEPWFLTKAHSLRVLKENINVVNAKLAHYPSQVPKGKSLYTSWATKCDKCGTSFEHVHEATESPEPPFLCEKCLELPL